jgi:hypothetical protein
MFVLILILIVQAYSEPLDTMLWTYTKQSCQDNCSHYGRGNCDQQQIIQANSPEKIQQIVKERILSLYVCVEYVKGNTVGYVRTGWFEYKCYYIDPELDIEDTAETCSSFSEINNLCACSHHEHTYMSHEPTTQPTSSPTLSFRPTSQPTSQPTISSKKSDTNNESNIYELSEDTIILIVVIILVLFVIVSPLLYKCFCIRKETNIVSVEGITPVIVTEPKTNEIPIAQAHIIETYPQPTAPPLKVVPSTEKIDIEMGLQYNQNQN